jgi:hypothetical protein
VSVPDVVGIASGLLEQESTEQAAAKMSTFQEDS